MRDAAWTNLDAAVADGDGLLPVDGVGGGGGEGDRPVPPVQGHRGLSGAVFGQHPPQVKRLQVGGGLQPKGGHEHVGRGQTFRKDFPDQTERRREGKGARIISVEEFGEK